MTQVTNDVPDTNSSKRARRTSLLLGVAAATVAAAVGIGMLVSSDDEGSKSATTTNLALGAAAGKCLPPSAELIAGQEIAFEGTVTSIENGVVTLDPSTFYSGAETDVVTVDEPDLNMTEMPVEFVVGEQYIVGATNGTVSICGLSGPATDELRALYDEAFGR